VGCRTLGLVHRDESLKESQGILGVFWKNSKKKTLTHSRSKMKYEE